MSSLQPKKRRKRFSLVSTHCNAFEIRGVATDQEETIDRFSNMLQAMNNPVYRKDVPIIKEQNQVEINVLSEEILDTAALEQSVR